eukprot:TRINITY_DN3649_c0_g1_i5.p1 TRINITY_DN3649_c0_g1~~TRINITY_DN3649_c0_g1_i5.p1  ORF type:complete len:302 (-),score=61.58 TRINITY_DN3649_c0_g1_i5:39-944(-)
MCIRDRYQRRVRGQFNSNNGHILGNTMIHHSLRTGVQWRPARRRMMEFVAVAALTALVVSTFSCRDRTPPTSEALPAVPVPQPALLPKSLSAFLGELKTTATPHTRAAILCSQARLVPSVFLIGGTKTGTTAMFHSLRKSVSFLHSGVPIDGENEWAAKEKFFWNLKYHKGRQWYTLHFPGCPGVVHGAQSRVAGRWGVEMPEMGPDALPHAAIDLTANLFISPEAPARIKKAYGPMSRHLTFLFMMKHDPTQLVHSSIWMSFPQELSLIHISEPTRLLSISYAVFCLKKKKKKRNECEMI